MPGYLDDLLGKTVLSNGAPLPDRKLLNFRSGADVVVADNPALQSTDVSIFGASYVRAFGDVIAAVNLGSGEDTNPLRPPVLTDGDYSAYPFQHIAPAVAALPLHLGGFALRLNIGAGTFGTGVNLGGFIGGSLELIGTWATPTLTTGVTSGTAGAGSAGSALNKPTAAANWTASNLVGHKVRVTGGSGFTGSDALNETVRIIKANTTTQLTLQESISGLDSTTTFAIVTEGTIINGAAALTVDGDTCLLGMNMCHAKIVLRRIKLDNASTSADFALITNGVNVADLGSVRIDGDWVGEEVDRIVLSAVTIGGSVVLDNCGVLDAVAYLPAGGSFQLLGFKEVLAFIAAIGCTNTALRVLHTNYVGREIDAQGCTATPFEGVNVQYSEPVGNGLTGTNASAPFAAFVTGGGRHVFTGSTMTSTTGNQLDLDGYALSWTTLADRNYHRAGTFAIWSDDRWAWLGQQKIINDSSTPFDDLQVDSIQIQAYKKEYCADRALPTTDVGSGDYSAGAYAEIVAYAGGGQLNAFKVGFQVTKIKTCATNGDSVRFFTDVEVGGSGFGTHGEIWNATAHTPSLYPPSGQKIIFNGSDLGTNNPATLVASRRYAWFTDSAGAWYVDGP